ncbi:MAG: ABC transporter permease, partial [Clostridia bacterium]|nr:ABC transporter permease [Clostridia bacterium]
SQMAEVTNAFSEMGSFSSAFGMDRLNFGEFMGYFAVECGNVLGLGGALFAAIYGISAIAKEEKEATAEFLYTQPISRMRVIAEKYLALIFQVVALNVAVCGISLCCILAIGESVDFGVLFLLFLSYLILQIEIASVCFGFSAFVGKGSTAVGIGFAFLLYFLNLIANITDKAKVLKYVTPFAYCDGADIAATSSLEWKYVAVGAALAAAGVAAAFIRYKKKDL